MLNQSSLKDFDIILKLGQGSFGIVYKVKRKIDNNIYVLKQINISKMNKAMKADAINEVTILSTLNHQHIVKYHDSFIDKNFLNIIMEYCQGGDLCLLLKSQLGRPLSENKIWSYFIQMCLGLEYIHKKKILHRDIKTMNVFLDKDNQVRIGDLGVAKVLQENNDFARTMIGTPFYLSPEMCEEKPYNDKSDVWALGCVLYEMCTFKHPFEAKTQAALILKIIRGKYDPIPGSYSKELEDLVQCCLRGDYRSRPNVAGILQKQSIIHKAAEMNINLSLIDNRPSNYKSSNPQPQVSKDKDIKNIINNPILNKQPVVQKNDPNSKISNIQQQIIQQKPALPVQKTPPVVDKIEKKPEIVQVDKKKDNQKIETPKIQQKQQPPVKNNIFNDPKPIQNPYNDKQVIVAQKKEVSKSEHINQIQKQPEKQLEQQIIKIKSSAFDNKPVYAFEGKPPSAPNAKIIPQTPQQEVKPPIVANQKQVTPQTPQQANKKQIPVQQQYKPSVVVQPLEKQQVNPVVKKELPQQVQPQQIQQQQKNKDIKSQQVIQNKPDPIVIKKSDSLEQKNDKKEIKILQKNIGGGVNIKPLKKPQLFGVEKPEEKKPEIGKKMKDLQAQKQQYQKDLSFYDKQEQDMILNLPDSMLPKKKDSNSSSSSVEIEFEEIKNPYSVDMNQNKQQFYRHDIHIQQQIVDDQFMRDEFASDEEISTTNHSEQVKQEQARHNKQQPNEPMDIKQVMDLDLKYDNDDQESKQQTEYFEIQNHYDDDNQVIESESDTPYEQENSDTDQQVYECEESQSEEPQQQEYQPEERIIEYPGEEEDIDNKEVQESEKVDMGEDEEAEENQQMNNKQSVTSYIEEQQKKLYELIQREKELKTLLDLKHQDCVNQLDSQKFNDILCFFRNKLNSDQELTSEDQEEIDKIIQQHMINHHNPQIIYTIYKILHLEIELEKTKEKIQGLVSRLDHLQIDQSQIQI